MMPIPFQPIGYRHYFSLKQLKVPKFLTHNFYSSWEDALWDIVFQTKIGSGAIVLIPDFFCTDVVDSMKDHDLVPQYYPVDRDFQTDPVVFANHLSRLQPDIVVILHAVGITNQLFSKNKIWIQQLKSKAILIEDSVHRVVDPAKIELITSRHVVIDSLRKVVPIPGSNLYGSKDFINFSSPAWHQAFLYQISVFGYWLFFQLLLKLSFLTLNSHLQNYMLLASEKMMLTGYNRIGKSYASASGWFLWKWMAHHLNLDKIYHAKQNQARIYYQTIKSLKNNQLFFDINVPKSDYGQLRGYPLGLTKKTSEIFTKTLRAKGLIFRLELNDSIWSRGGAVIYLPMGPHLKDGDIHKVCKIISECSSLKL